MAKQTHLKVKQSLSGVFNLSFYIGQVVKIGEGKDITEKQAEEIVNIGYGEYSDSSGKEAEKKETADKNVQENADLKKALEGYVAEIYQLKEFTKTKDAEIETAKNEQTSLNTTINNLRAEIVEHKNTITNKHTEIESLKDQLTEKQVIIDKFNAGPPAASV